MRDPNQIITYSGIDMDPFEPKKEQIAIEDVAHALSLLCRANGHISHFYSVAQHCLNCEREAEKRGCDVKTRLFCLLHDATECYISDLTRPVKRRLPLYYEAEERLAEVVYSALAGRLPTESELKQVGEIDDCLLYHEFINLGGIKMYDNEPYHLAEFSFEFELPAEVEKRYIAKYNSLCDMARSTKERQNG